MSIMRTYQFSPNHYPYVLHDRVYCVRCMNAKPNELVDANYGKMRPGWDHRRNQAWYRCLARDRGYKRCEQGYVATNLIDEQVAQALQELIVPEGLQARVETAIQSKVEHAEAFKRMAEVEEIVKRIDFSWEQGFMTPKEYVAKRSQLQREIEALKPVDYG